MGIDIQPFSIKFNTYPSSSREDNSDVEIVPAFCKIPYVRTLTISKILPFTLIAGYTNGEQVGSYHISSDDHQHCDPVLIKLSFRINIHGIFEVYDATLLRLEMEDLKLEVRTIKEILRKKYESDEEEEDEDEEEYMNRFNANKKNEKRKKDAIVNSLFNYQEPQISHESTVYPDTISKKSKRKKDKNGRLVEVHGAFGNQAHNKPSNQDGQDEKTDPDFSSFLESIRKKKRKIAGNQN